MSKKKEAGKNTSSGRDKYTNTMQTETYRQQMSTEKRILQARTKSDMDRMNPLFSENNNYLHFMKKKDVILPPSINYKHPIEQLENVENEYCQKCKKDKSFCPHKLKEQPDAKVYLQYPVTNSQSYGWMAPIDTLNFGYGIKSSLDPADKFSFRGGKEQKEKKEAEKTEKKL